MKRRRSRGLGAVNPDATAAIKAARKGRCKTALRHLYDASPLVQTANPTERHRQDYRVASIIVAQHCGGGERPHVIRSRTGKKYHYPGFEGARRKRRRRR